jgi:hypothetical protein
MWNLPGPVIMASVLNIERAYGETDGPDAFIEKAENVHPLGFIRNLTRFESYVDENMCE